MVRRDFGQMLGYLRSFSRRALWTWGETMGRTVFVPLT